MKNTWSVILIVMLFVFIILAPTNVFSLEATESIEAKEQLISPAVEKELREKATKELKTDQTSQKNEEPEIIETASEEISKEEAKLVLELGAAKKKGDGQTVLVLEEQLAKLRDQQLEFIGPTTDDNVKFVFSDGASQEEGFRWVENDILVAGRNASEIRPSMASDSDGNLYTAVEYDGADDTYIYIYRSTDSGQTWQWWFYLYGGGDNTDPSIAVGENADEKWLILAISTDDIRIKVFRIRIYPSYQINGTILETNVLGVSNPRVVTDTAEYGYWYPYIVYNSKGVDNWVLEFSRSLNYGLNWTTPTSIYGYCGYPDEFYNAQYGYPDIDFGSGDLYASFDNFPPGCTATTRDVYVKKSTDFGGSWVSAVRLTTSGDDEYDPGIGAVKNYANKTVDIAYTRYWSGSDLDVWYAWTQNGGITWNTNYCIACSYDNEQAPDVTTSSNMGAIHAAYWHDWDIDYSSAGYLSPNVWSIREQINEFNAASWVYPRPGIVANPILPVSEEAGITWTDFRNPTTTYDIYFDAPSTMTACYDYDDAQYIIPPSAGDWNIIHRIECNSTTITLNGNLNINNMLSFNGVTLRMNVNTMGEYSIEVNPGGSFYVNSYVGTPSVLRNGDNASAYPTFRVHSGSVFEMRNSEVHNFGFAWNLPNYDQAGLWINTNGVVIQNSLIDNNHFVGLLFYYSTGHSVRGSTFTANDWDSILLLSTNNTVIDNNTITSSESDSGIEVSSSNGVSVTNNRVSYSGDVGIDVAGSPGIIIRGNRVTNSGNDGIVISSSPGSTVSYNNATSNGDDGIVISSSSSTPVTFNNASSNGDTGIAIYSSNNVVVANNTAKNNWRGIYVSSSANNRLERNIVGPSTWYGIHFYLTTDSFVINNTISSSQGEWDSTGLYLSYSPRSTINLNRVMSNLNGMVLWYSENSTIQDNNVTGNGNLGISLQNSHRTPILRNKVRGNGDGISLSSSNFVNITDNNATQNSVGIYLLSSNWAIIRNNNASSNSVGISLSGSSNNRIYNNNVNSNAYGISLTSSSSSNTINNNNVLSNNFGLSLQWSSNFNNVTVNDVRNSIDYGAYLFRVDSNNVTINNLSNAQSTGVYLERSNFNRLYNNNIKNSVNYGMNLFESDNNVLDTNDVRYSGDVGIELSSSDFNSITNNQATQSGIGLSLRWANNNNVQNNVMNGNTMNAFLLQSNNNMLQNNQLNNGNNLGLELSASNGNNIIHNFANNNQEYGIHLYSSQNNVVNDNQVNVNGIGVYLDWSPLNNITNNFAENNSLIGMAAVYNSNDNRIIDNYANNNGNISIKVSHSDRNNIYSNDASGSVIGIFLDWSENNNIEQNTANNNDAHGITLEWYSNGNKIYSNAVNGNIVGISLMWSSNNNVTQNSANNNNVSLNLEWQSNFNKIMNNQLRNNGYNGIGLFWDSNSNDILQNNISNDFAGGGSGIYSHYSKNSNIRNNIINSVGYGIYLSFSQNQNIYNNWVCNNSQFDFYVHNSINNIGDDNSCYAADGWNDQGATGCTNPCYGYQAGTDLELSNFVVTYPEQPNTEEPVVFRFYITNHAGYTVDNIYWTVDSDSPDVDAFNTVPMSLGPDQMAIVFATINYSAPGTYHPTATVDPDNRIYETNVNNNAQTIEVDVGGGLLKNE